MNSTKRMLPYVRQYVIVAVYDIMDQDGFIIGGCVLIGLIGVFFLWTGYQHLLWTYYQHIFMKIMNNYEKYGGREK